MPLPQSSYEPFVSCWNGMGALWKTTQLQTTHLYRAGLDLDCNRAEASSARKFLESLRLAAQNDHGRGRRLSEKGTVVIHFVYKGLLVGRSE